MQIFERGSASSAAPVSGPLQDLVPISEVTEDAVRDFAGWSQNQYDDLIAFAAGEMAAWEEEMV
jgi:hypothetical protein